MMFRYFTVEYVFMNEATPRTVHGKTVRADNAAVAAEAVLARLILAGDTDASVTGVINS